MPNDTHSELQGKKEVKKNSETHQSFENQGKSDADLEKKGAAQKKLDDALKYMDGNQPTGLKIKNVDNTGKQKGAELKDGKDSKRPPPDNAPKPENRGKVDKETAKSYGEPPARSAYSNQPLNQKTIDKYQDKAAKKADLPEPSAVATLDPPKNQFERIRLDPQQIKQLGQPEPEKDVEKKEDPQTKTSAKTKDTDQGDQRTDAQQAEQQSINQQKIDQQKAATQQVNDGSAQPTNAQLQAKKAESIRQRTGSNTNQDVRQKTNSLGQNGLKNDQVTVGDTTSGNPKVNYHKVTVTQNEQNLIDNKQYVKPGDNQVHGAKDPFSQGVGNKNTGTANDVLKSNATGGTTEDASGSPKEGSNRGVKDGSITKYDPKGTIQAENQAQTERLDNKESRLQPKEPKHTINDDKGDTRPGEIIDKSRDPRKFETEKGGKKFGDSDTKSGSKIDVKIDGKGKRIGLDGKEILVWDGKNSPLYPNQKGKRVTRFVDQGKKIKVGKDGKIKVGDQKAELTPAEKAHIDKVIKETDRIFFGEKKSEGTKSTKGESGGSIGKHRGDDTGSGTKSTSAIKGDQSSGRTGKSDVRSGINTTKVSKGDAGATRGETSTKGDTAKPAKGKFGGLPDYAPFPGLKLPEFKIRWPNWKTSRGDRGPRPTDGNTGKGAKATKFEGANKPDRVKNAESTKITDKQSGKISTKDAVRNLDTNIRSVNKNFGKLLPESGAKAKLVRSFPTRGEVPKGVEATQYKPLTLKPSKISIGTKAHSDATFIPSSVMIQPIDWSGIRGWLAIRGILKSGKSSRGFDSRVPGRRATGDTRTAKDNTTKTGTGTVVSDSTRQSSKTSSDTATKKTAEQGKAKNNLDSRLVDSKGKKANAKSADQKFEMKESGDAFGGKLPSIKMTTKPSTGSVKPFDGSKVKADAGGDAQGKEPKTQQAKELSSQIQKDLKPINTGKAGILKFEHTSARSGKEVSADQKYLEGETGATKSIKSDSSKSKQASDKAKLNIEGKDGRAILKDLVLSNGLKGWTSKRNSKLLDGARIVRGAHLVAFESEVGKAKTRSIHEILAGTKLGKTRRNFTPEITESGSYKVARNMSSGQILALGSSSRHPAINFDSSVSEGKVSHDWGLQENKEDENLYKRKTKTTSEEKARRTYTVKEGDTPELIAVVELSNADLAPLICEINRPAFVQMYDTYKEEHVDTLLPGTLILLPNESDIEEFKNQSQ